MGTFRKAIHYKKSSKSLDEKIQRLDEELIKTGFKSSDNSSNKTNHFDWRNEFGQKVDVREEVDIAIDQIKEKNKYLSSVENSIKQHKLNEANITFNEIYGEQVNTVVENYISKYAGEINDLKEDIFVELSKKPKNLKVIENRLDELDDKYNLLSEKIYKSLKTYKEQNLSEESQVSYRQLKDHYQKLVSKLQEQLAMAGSGGGEVRLKYLDDIVGIATNPSAYDGKFLKYDHSQEKFVFQTLVSGGGGGGINYDDLSVITTAASNNSSLSYDNITGIFLYSPPSLSEFITENDLVGFTTSGDLVGFTTSGDLVGFTTSGDLVGFTTNGDLVGFTTNGDLVGFTTSGDLVGYILNDSDGSSLTGIVTSIVGGVGIDVTQSTGKVIITATGGSTSGIAYSDLSAYVTSPGISTLSYDDEFGIFTYTPPNLSGYATTESLVGFVTSGDINGFISQDSDGSSLVGIVTSIQSGSGISINQSTGIVVISATGEFSGIQYSDLSAFNESPGESSLSYDNTTGIFSYVPPDLTSYLNNGDDGSSLIGIVTSIISGGGISVNNNGGNYTLTVPEYASESYVGNLVAISTVGLVNESYVNSSVSNSFDNLNPSYLAVSGISTFNAGIQEAFATFFNVMGTVVHDCSNGHIFYHISPFSTWTINLTNLFLTAEYATTISVVINQTSNPYIPSGLEIDGVPQSIKWQGNSPPSATISGIDVVSFSILNDGGTYLVMGQSVSFGGV